MEKAGSEVTGYAIEWKVEPRLWSGGEIEPFELERIVFTLYAERIRAEIVNPSMDWDEFCKKAEDILTTVIFPSCALSRNQDFRFKRLRDWILEEGKWRRSQRVICRARLKLQDSADVISEERDTEKEDRELCLEIMELSNKNPTLLGALNYYSLALKGADQLATAGNLYMAMEELWNNPEFGNLKGLAEKLGLPHSELKQVKRMTNEGRHAFVARRQTKPLAPGQIKECKQGVRELILAYVGWLRENRRG